MELIDRVWDTLRRVPHGALATVCPDGRPWNSPLFVAFDAQLRFYWSSHVDATHSRNIAERPDVLLVVFDSNQPDESGHAVYIRAVARELTDEGRIRAAVACLATRKEEPLKGSAEFTGPHPRRLYELTPEVIWTNVVKHENGHYYDERVVIDLFPTSMA